MRRLIIIFAGLVLLGGCVYIAPVTQGNYLKSSRIASLKVGMTKEQVRYLFGEPMMRVPFKSNAWYYVYYSKAGQGAKPKRYRLTVYFKGNKVSRFTTSAPIADAPS